MIMRLILPLVLLGGCATTQQADRGPDPRLTEALADMVAGKSQNCIPIDRASGSEIFRDAILYRAGGRKVWLADAPGCVTSGSNDYILVQNIYGSQLCRGDTIRLVERTGGFGAGFCAIRGFTPYTKPKG